MDAIAKGWVQRWQAKNWKNSAKEATPNVDLWKQLLEMCSQHDVEFVWLNQHFGNKDYNRCDNLARQAANQQDLPTDEGYQK